jgi:hypothetical protein
VCPGNNRVHRPHPQLPSSHRAARCRPAPCCRRPLSTHSKWRQRPRRRRRAWVSSHRRRCRAPPFTPGLADHSPWRHSHNQGHLVRPTRAHRDSRPAPAEQIFGRLRRQWIVRKSPRAATASSREWAQR